MLACHEQKPRAVLCFAALTCGALLLSSCTMLSIPQSLEGPGKRVAVMSLVREDVRVTRTGGLSQEVVYLDMDGQIRRTIEEVFASQLAATRPTWVIEPLNYDRDLRFSQRPGAEKARFFTLSGYEDRFKAEVTAVIRSKNLDAALLVIETAHEDLTRTFPGVGVILVGVPGISSSASIVSQADVHCTLVVFVVDSQGNVVAIGDRTGMQGARTFDRDRSSFSYSIAENLKPPFAERLRAGVTQCLAHNLKRQLDRMGI
jgi:hypothetical protein